MAPVSTVPAVPTTRNGVSPARRSVLIAFSSASRSIRWRSSTGIKRSASLPMPQISMAFPMQLCAAAEA